MARDFDKAPIDRRERGVDAATPEEEPITEQIAERQAKLESLRSENEQLGGEVIYLADYLDAQPRADTLENRQPSDPTDFNSVAQLFGDVVKRLQSEGRSRGSIDEAQRKFAKAAAIFAKQMHEGSPTKKEAAQKAWQLEASRALAYLPLTREVISWDAPDARELDVPEADREYIDQVRETPLGLDGKIDSWVYLEVAGDAPVDVQRRFYVAKQREILYRNLAIDDKWLSLFSSHRDDASRIASEQGVDQKIIAKAIEEADRLFAEHSRASQEAFDAHMAIIRGLEGLSDTQIEEHGPIHEVQDRFKPKLAQRRSQDAVMSAIRGLDRFLSKSAEAK